MPFSNKDASFACEIAHLQNNCPIFLAEIGIIRILTFSYSLFVLTCSLLSKAAPLVYLLL